MSKDEMRRSFKEERRHKEERMERREHRRPQRHGEFDERCYSKPFSKSRMSQKTKMFMSKEDLVQYVNDIGEAGNRKIDVYKIEDSLYKVVVVERVTEHNTREKEVE